MVCNLREKVQAFMFDYYWGEGHRWKGVGIEGQSEFLRQKSTNMLRMVDFCVCFLLMGEEVVAEPLARGKWEKSEEKRGVNMKNKHKSERLSYFSLFW